LHIVVERFVDISAWGLFKFSTIPHNEVLSVFCGSFIPKCQVVGFTAT